MSNLARRRRDVGLPFALGLVCLGGWAAAFALGMGMSATTFSLAWLALRVAQGALVSLPLLILVVGVARAGKFWRETERGLWGAPMRLAVAIGLIVLSLTPIFLAVAPQPATANNGTSTFLAIIAAVFSLGLALGFAWGAHIRPNFSGALIGLMGSLGLAAPLVIFGIIGLLQSQQAATQCHGSIGGCAAAAGVATGGLMLLIFSPIIIGFGAIIGSSFGAFLSGE